MTAKYFTALLTLICMAFFGCGVNEKENVNGGVIENSKIVTITECMYENPVTGFASTTDFVEINLETKEVVKKERHFIFASNFEGKDEDRETITEIYKRQLTDREYNELNEILIKLKDNEQYINTSVSSAENSGSIFDNYYYNLNMDGKSYTILDRKDMLLLYSMFRNGKDISFENSINEIKNPQYTDITKYTYTIKVVDEKDFSDGKILYCEKEDRFGIYPYVYLVYNDGVSIDILYTLPPHLNTTLSSDMVVLKKWDRDMIENIKIDEEARQISFSRYTLQDKSDMEQCVFEY